VMDVALDASGEDYNAYVPIMNALNALGKQEVNKNILQRCCAALENHLAQVPEDARARILLGSNYAELGRVEDAMRETNLAITLRPDEASILYNAACMYCFLKKKSEALSVLNKAWEAGFKDAGWARRDPDLTLLHGEPEFERMYPASQASGGA
jgi:Flp pilus assembly protein TadD